MHDGIVPIQPRRTHLDMKNAQTSHCWIRLVGGHDTTVFNTQRHWSNTELQTWGRWARRNGLQRETAQVADKHVYWLLTRAYSTHLRERNLRETQRASLLITRNYELQSHAIGVRVHTYKLHATYEDQRAPLSRSRETD